MSGHCPGKRDDEVFVGNTDFLRDAWRVPPRKHLKKEAHRDRWARTRIRALPSQKGMSSSSTNSDRFA